MINLNSKYFIHGLNVHLNWELEDLSGYSFLVISSSKSKKIFLLKENTGIQEFTALFPEMKIKLFRISFRGIKLIESLSVKVDQIKIKHEFSLSQFNNFTTKIENKKLEINNISAQTENFKFNNINYNFTSRIKKIVLKSNTISSYLINK